MRLIVAVCPDCEKPEIRTAKLRDGGTIFECENVSCESYNVSMDQSDLKFKKYDTDDNEWYYV